MGRRLEMPPACKRCGRYVKLEYGGYCRPCRPHAMFIEAIKHAYDEDQVRVNHTLYQIHPEPIKDLRHPIEPTGGRGFGGQKFVIQFNDGRVVTTRNLFWVGDIPEEYWEALPDNAVFLQKGGARVGT